MPDLQEITLKIYNEKECNRRWLEALGDDAKEYPSEAIRDGQMCTLTKAGEGLCRVCEILIL